jgi:hypothetical protein
MNRLRSIAIEEHRQLVTLGFAVIVFLMTLLALQLHGQGSTLSRVGRANREGVGHAQRLNGAARPENRAVALAATSIDSPTSMDSPGR